jgi:hypothetical protein
MDVSTIGGVHRASRTLFPTTNMNAKATDAGRNDGLDALRGLFLVLMTLTHMPTSLQSALGQPFGLVSAAEGFVLLSAFLAGQVYLRRGLRQGFAAMRRSLWSRAAVVYRHHLGLFGFGISMVLVLGMVNERDAVTNLFTQYLAQPLTSAAAALALLYQPPLLDILPMYVLFLLLSPWVLEYARRHGWGGPLVASLVIWAAALLGLRASVYDAVMAWTGIPMHATGAFNLFAWQFLWVIGLWLGTARTLGDPAPMATTRRTVVLVGLLAASFLAWRHVGGQVPFGLTPDGAPAAANLLVDKWNLGPLRMMNVFALAVLLAAFGPSLARRLPLGGLAHLGRSSLPVFSAHIACCLLALACFGAPTPDGTLWLDAALIAGSLGVMIVVAHLHQLSGAPDGAAANREIQSGRPWPAPPVLVPPLPGIAARPSSLAAVSPSAAAGGGDAGSGSSAA